MRIINKAYKATTTDYNAVTYLYPDSGVSDVNRKMKSECYRKSWNTTDINHKASSVPFSLWFAKVMTSPDVTKV